MDKRALIISDCHIPFENKAAYELMMFVAKDIRLDEIILLGDFADFYNLSSFDKDPGVLKSLEDERYEVCNRLKEIKEEFPKAKKIFLEGNHEKRMSTWINKTKEFYGMVTTEKFLRLKDYGYEFVPYSPWQSYDVLGSGLQARHEPLSGGFNPALSINKAGSSIIMGHTHRVADSDLVTLDGRHLRGISAGWLGDKNNKVFGFVKNNHQWSLAFTVVTYTNEKILEIEVIRITEKNNNCYCLFEGNKYKN